MGGEHPDKSRKNCDYHGLLVSDGTHTQQMSSKDMSVPSFRAQLEHGLRCRLWSQTDMVGLLRQSFLPCMDWTKLTSLSHFLICKMGITPTLQS